MAEDKPDPATQEATGDVELPESEDTSPAAASGEETGGDVPPATNGEPTEDSTPLEEARQRIEDLEGRLLRARADYDNLQKRVARDSALERERVKARVLEGFLHVYEYGRMAVTEAEKHPGPLAEGVRMVVREFERVLESEGLTSMGTVGELFDATQHEAVGEEAAEGVVPGAISRVVKTGYRLGDRVLRYAQVMVAPQATTGPMDSREAPGHGDDDAAKASNES